MRRKCPATSHDPHQYILIFLVLSGVLYNALLSFVNAHVMQISVFMAAGCELIIIGCAILAVVADGLRKDDVFLSIYIGFTLAISIIVSIAHQSLFIDMLRNWMIICLFFTIGTRMSLHSLRLCFQISAYLVFSVLFIEIFALNIFGLLFNPASFFANTRGVELFSLDESGLFRNALGYEGRFTFGVFSGPRTSSLFLEQVSLANFASVLSLFAMCFWVELNNKEKVGYVSLVMLIILSNNSRTSSILAILLSLGFWIFPRLPRYGHAFVMPAVLILGILVFNSSTGEIGDDFIGRINITMNKLYDMDVKTLFVGDLTQLVRSYDSGVAYIIYGSTIFGTFLFWNFILCVNPRRNSRHLRAAYGLVLFMAFNLMIGGTAVFSMKIATLLWAAIGYASRGVVPKQLQKNIRV